MKTSSIIALVAFLGGAIFVENSRKHFAIFLIVFFLISSVAIKNSIGANRYSYDMKYSTVIEISKALDEYEMDSDIKVVPKGGLRYIDRGTLTALHQKGYLKSIPSSLDLNLVKRYIESKERALEQINPPSGILLERIEALKSAKAIVPSGFVSKVTKIEPAPVGKGMFYYLKQFLEIIFHFE